METKLARIAQLSKENPDRVFTSVGRFAQENCRKRGTKPETFDFLGFTHYCFRGRNGKFRVKRKTSRKKFAKKCKEAISQLDRPCISAGQSKNLCQYLRMITVNN